MKIIGIEIGHDSSCCLIEDGQIVRFAQEERYNRLKVATTSVYQCVNYCLGEYKPSDIDMVCMVAHIASVVEKDWWALLDQDNILFLPLYMKNKFPSFKNHVVLDHHKCHASGGYYTSGFNDALIITFDGIGRDTTDSVYIGEGNEIKCLYENKITITDGIWGNPKSLGWFYAMITEALGWQMSEGEGKTMGLASYGNPEVIPKDLIEENMFNIGGIGHYVIDGRIHRHMINSKFYKQLAEEYGDANLAASAQQVLEEHVIKQINEWLEKTKKRNLVVSGGVFMNVKLNQKIRESCDIDGFYPFPLSADYGCSIGSAMCYYYNELKKEYKPERLKHLYYGDEFSNEYILKIIERNKLSYIPYDENYIVKLLADNKIIGWFQGKMEAGARALGNRSILMSPLKAENKDTINATVKFRESFRPFCPSVTREKADCYFDIKDCGEFMIESCNVKVKDIPAVTHIDNTARPQIVDKEINPKFHSLLTEFGNVTGHPVLLNTSFNIKGEPIVRTPDEAIRCFYGTGLDILVLGDYIIKK